MAHSNFHLRLLGCFSLIICIVGSTACRGKQTPNRGEREEIALDQNVTVRSKPVDVVFKDFENNWRKFVSDNPKLALPVVGEVQRREAAPEPIITPECVYSDTAKGYVPRITITWNQAGGQAVSVRSARTQEVQQTQQAEPEQPPEMRIDLGLHHDPFTRNYFSSVLSTEFSKRFSLPPNSALLSNPEAVRLTGPGLFPQLMSVRTQLLQDAATKQQIARSTVVLQELSEGLSYDMRVSRPAGNQWTTDQQFIFVSPVCQNSF
jgi:hypothetical protein